MMIKLLNINILLFVYVLCSAQLIADHTAVDEFDSIPAAYIDSVKKRMVCFPGASHSIPYRTGLTLLEDADATYQVNVATEEAYTDEYLRCNDIGRNMYGEEWYTWYSWPEQSRPDEADSAKNMIKRNSDNGHPYSVFGYSWCWNMMSNYISQTTDPIYGVHWMGLSTGGYDQGDLLHGWGLDSADKDITGNYVCMDTYLGAIDELIQYCEDSGYVTQMVFTTGPADKWVYHGEAAYQGHIKTEYIRNYVNADASRVLFDYDDILCYDNGSSERHDTTVNGYTYPCITPANLGDGSIGHIGPIGAVRIGKAQWWLLARLAGWEGVTEEEEESEIPVKGSDGKLIIYDNKIIKY